MYSYKKIRLPGKVRRTIDEHRFVMENHLGRKLHFNECVHHKDGNKRNNDIDNLEVISRSEHMKQHLKNGDIKFYVRTDAENHSLRLKRAHVTEEIAKRIKYNGENVKYLTSLFNISRYVVYDIRNGRTWKILPPHSVTNPEQDINCSLSGLDE